MSWARIFVVVEGQTEAEFVKDVLAAHLRSCGANEVEPKIVVTHKAQSGKESHGGGRWKHYRADVLRLLGQNKGPSVRVTTLLDLYRIPDDCPGYVRCSAFTNTTKRALELERALRRSIPDWRFIPYIQRHEFEAFVLASLDELEGYLDQPDALEGLASLRAKIGGYPPEDINDGAESAPSKRLQHAIPSYQKTLHGPLVTFDAGLTKLRSLCPRFDAWIERLEGELTQMTK